jgi:hypothetical protein
MVIPHYFLFKKTLTKFYNSNPLAKISIPTIFSISWRFTTTMLLSYFIGMMVSFWIIISGIPWYYLSILFLFISVLVSLVFIVKGVAKYMKKQPQA